MSTKGFGQSILCGHARIDGWAVGIVANERQVVKSKKGEMKFGGVIYSDSADKAARFIMNVTKKRSFSFFTRCHRIYGRLSILNMGELLKTVQKW